MMAITKGCAGVILMESKSIIVARSNSDWINYVCDENLADSLIVPRKKHPSSIIGKLSATFAGLGFMWLLFKERKRINQYHSLVVVGNNTSLGALVMHRLGFIRTKKVVWWGFFLHSYLSIWFYGILSRIFESKRVVYVLFSNFEKKLYKNIMGMRGEVISLPYGNWKTVDEHVYVEKDYYFAGGYSNRDYLSLIEAFTSTEHKLVIIASKHNKELDGVVLPQNITLLRDVDKETFHQYLGESKGVIIPLKHNLGSSGQMVTLHAMARKKAIIINDNDIMKEYVEDGVSGLIADDIRKNVIEKIEQLESDAELKHKVQMAVYERYMSEYSREPCKEKTMKVMKQILV